MPVLAKSAASTSKSASATKTAPKKQPGIPLSADSRLGLLVRDSASGFEGVTTIKIEQMNGNVQFAVQPKGAADKMIDANCLDFHLLEEVGPGLSNRATKAVHASLKLGERAYDHVSGYAGVVVEKWTFLNGCIYFSIQGGKGRHNMFGEIPGALRFSQDRLRPHSTFGKRLVQMVRNIRLYWSGGEPELVLTQRGEIAPHVSPPAPKPVRRPPGGPSRSMSSLRSSVR